MLRRLRKEHLRLRAPDALEDLDDDVVVDGAVLAMVVVDVRLQVESEVARLLRCKELGIRLDEILPARQRSFLAPLVLVEFGLEVAAVLRASDRLEAAFSAALRANEGVQGGAVTLPLPAGALRTLCHAAYCSQAETSGQIYFPRIAAIMRRHVKSVRPCRSVGSRAN